MSTWVLLRGLMRERRHWGDFPARLQAHLPDARLFMPDPPGNGALHALPSATCVADMVESCRAQLRACGAPAPYHVLALSLGAMVAVEWSARYPGEVAGAVLINTSMRPFSRFYQRLRWRNYPAVLKLALLGGVERQERTILALTSRRHAHDRALKQSWAAYQSDAPVGRRNALRQLWAAARYRAPSRRPDVPMLVLAAEKDGLVDVRCSIALARAWGIDCALHPDAGHDLPLDEGEWVAAQVASWCRSMEVIRGLSRMDALR